MNRVYKKRVYILLFFYLLFFGALAISSVVLFQKFQAKFYKKIEASIIVEKENIKNFIPSGHILFEDMIQESPDGNYFIYLTAKDLSMRESRIWMIQKNGKNNRVINNGTEFSYVTNPTWNLESDKIAFIKVYPFELWIASPRFSIFEDRTDQRNLKFELIYSQDKEKDENILNPSLGYGGKTFLKWNEFDEIEFEDNNAIPNKRYAINIYTKKVREVEFVEETQQDSLDGLNFELQSQRDLNWKEDALGTCENETIGSGGCAISVVSMLFNAYGIESDPAKLNSWLKGNSNQGYFGCDIRWNIAAHYSKNIKLVGAYFNEGNFDRIDYELNRGNPVIIGFNKVPFTNIPHWVLVTGKVDNEYLIIDPWSLKKDEVKTLENFGDEFDHMIVYQFNY